MFVKLPLALMPGPPGIRLVTLKLQKPLLKFTNGVFVGVGVGVLVGVEVGVSVTVGVPGVLVTVGVSVTTVAVPVGVATVGVEVGVCAGVDVRVGVAVAATGVPVGTIVAVCAEMSGVGVVVPAAACSFSASSDGLKPCSFCAASDRRCREALSADASAMIFELTAAILLLTASCGSWMPAPVKAADAPAVIEP